MKRLGVTILGLATTLMSACASSPPPPPVAAAPAADAAQIIPPAPATDAVKRPPSSPAAVRGASAILGDAIKAMGEPDAWNAHKTAHLSMTMSFQAVGITGTAERFATSKDQVLVVTKIPGVGEVREGSNGKVFWSQDPINGLRLLDGAEAEQARSESVWNPELRVNDLYRKVDSMNEAGPDGKPLECVVLTPKVGPSVTRCYDPATHLQVLEKGVRPTPQGDTPYTSTVSDWRVAGGLKSPFALETTAGPITFSARVANVTFDEPMDDKQFEPPQPAAVTPTEAPPAPAAAAAKPGKTGKAGAKAKPAGKPTKTKAKTK